MNPESKYSKHVGNENDDIQNNENAQKHQVSCIRHN